MLLVINKILGGEMNYFVFFSFNLTHELGEGGERPHDHIWFALEFQNGCCTMHQMLKHISI